MNRSILTIKIKSKFNTIDDNMKIDIIISHIISRIDNNKRKNWFLLSEPMKDEEYNSI